MPDFNKLWDEYDRLLKAYYQMSNEIEQTLAQAIGFYPWYKDDQANFPGTTEANGVCVGEHVPESLAMEAAKLIRDQRARIEKALELLQAAEGCCCHLNHETIPADGDSVPGCFLPEIPGTPPTESCCALRRERIISVLRG